MSFLMASAFGDFSQSFFYTVNNNYSFIFVYIGFALKNRRKPFIPDTLSLGTMDKWTPPFIILPRREWKMKKAILPPTFSAKAYKEKYSIGKIKDYIFQMSILL